MIHKKNEVNEQFLHYQEEFIKCEQVIKSHSESFYRAFSQLPKQKAWSVFAVYSFCRMADDTIDLYKNSDELDHLKLELDDFLAGNTPDRYFWRALIPVFQTYDMDEKAFYDMLIGQKMDANFQQPTNQNELETYAYYVAGSVGLMLLPILSSEAQTIKDQGIQLGQAMQLTNILRDIGEDFENQRIYLPKERMNNYRVTENMLQTGEITQSFIDLWENEASRAEQLYQEGLSMLSMIDQDCQEALLLAATFYRGILDAVRENDYDCLAKRNYIKKSTQLRLYRQVKRQLKIVQ